MTEYICVSCWTSFEIATSIEGDVLCPHCGFEQPAVDEYLAEDGTAPPPMATPVDEDSKASQEAESNETEATTEDSPTENPESADADSEEIGLEPISFDDLDELETDSADSSQETKNKPDKSTQDSQEKDAVQEPGETTEESGTEPQSSTPAPPIAWQFKGIHGMTYRFLDVNALVKWTGKLNDISSCLVSRDGTSWKMLKPFLQQIEEGSDPMAAFEQTAALASVAPAAPAPEGGDGAKPSRNQSMTRQRRTATSGTSGKSSGSGNRKSRSGGHTRRMERPRTSHGGARRTATSMTRTRTSTTGTMRAPRGSEAAGIPDWKSRLLYLSAGLVTGGVIVYFGMYFMGFYDLVF